MTAGNAYPVRARTEEIFGWLKTVGNYQIAWTRVLDSCRGKSRCEGGGPRYISRMHALKARVSRDASCRFFDFLVVQGRHDERRVSLSIRRSSCSTRLRFFTAPP